MLLQTALREIEVYCFDEPHTLKEIMEIATTTDDYESIIEIETALIAAHKSETIDERLFRLLLPGVQQQYERLATPVPVKNSAGRLTN